MLKHLSTRLLYIFKLYRRDQKNAFASSVRAPFPNANTQKNSSYSSSFPPSIRSCIPRLVARLVSSHPRTYPSSASPQSSPSSSPYPPRRTPRAWLDPSRPVPFSFRFPPPSSDDATPTERDDGDVHRGSTLGPNWRVMNRQCLNPRLPLEI